VRLGGTSVYFGRLVEKPIIGDPGQPLDQERYRQAIRLLYGTSLAMAAITLVGLLAARAGVWGVIPGLSSK
jgi:cobalamin biosynthesis protein CobD/CbiB